MNFCTTDKQIADIFTKALSRERFERNRLELGLIKTTCSFLLTPNAWLVNKFLDKLVEIIDCSQIWCCIQHISELQLVDTR